jgi:ABC-2 type transport system permease protein
MNGYQLRARLQHPLDFALGFVEGVLFQVTSLLYIIFVLPRLPAIGGWTYDEALFLAGFRLAVHAIYVPLFDNVQDLMRLVQTQELDRYIIRPRGTLSQVTTCTLQPNAIGDLLVATVVVTVALGRSGLQWTPATVIALAVLLPAGVATEAFVQISASSVTLWNGNGWQAKLLCEDILSRFGLYPLSIFPPLSRLLLTFVIPLAFAGYFQVHTLFHRSDPWWPARVALIGAVGALLAWATTRIWRAGLRRYQGVAA